MFKNSKLISKLQAGNDGEIIWKRIMEGSHTNIIEAPNKKFYDWDLKGTYKGRDLTYEVKYDVSGYKYAYSKQRPVNVYIEYKNTTKNEYSGILASKADYYVYILKNGINNEIYVFDRLELIDKLRELKPRELVNKTGGDNNAVGLVPSLESLKTIVKKIIYESNECV